MIKTSKKIVFRGNGFKRKAFMITLWDSFHTCKEKIITFIYTRQLLVHISRYGETDGGG